MRVYGRRPSAGGRVALVLALFAWPGVGATQTLQLQAGTSSLFNAHGASFEWRRGNTTWLASAGRIGGRTLTGGRLKTRVRGASLMVGDDTLELHLPTDVFGGGHYVPVRGAAVAVPLAGGTALIMGGATSTIFGAPYVRGGIWTSPLGVAMFERALTPRGRLMSRVIVSEHVTALQSVEWTLTPTATVAGSVAVGHGRPYLSPSLTLDRGWLGVTASYATRSPDFRRLDATTPLTAEFERENVSAKLKPLRWLSVTAARQHLVSSERAGDRVTIQQAGITLAPAGWRTNATTYETVRQGGLRTRSIMASAGRSLTSTLDLDVEHLSSHGPDGSTTSQMLRLREHLHPRVSLLQVATRSDGNLSVNFGGEFLSNLATVTVGYQNVYVPFAPQSFIQAATVDARVNVADVQVLVGTYITPTGSLRFTVSGTRFISATRASRQPRTEDFDRFLVQGRVVTEQGSPVEGAAVRIGTDVLLTDGEGRFVLYAARTKPLPVQVVSDPAEERFVVVTAPPSARPAPADRSAEILIVVRPLG